MLGEIGRGVAAYMGPGVYLDVALTWVFGIIETCPMAFRQEYPRPSGYSYRSLLSHFWQLVISAGTDRSDLFPWSGSCHDPRRYRFGTRDPHWARSWRCQSPGLYVADDRDFATWWGYFVFSGRDR